jgi:hypothetical protein
MPPVTSSGEKRRAVSWIQITRKPVMPRYFFHSADTSDRILDRDGLELPDDGVAILQATQAVREFMDEDQGQANWNGWSLHVVEEGGRVVVSMDLDKVRLH